MNPASEPGNASRPHGRAELVQGGDSNPAAGTDAGPLSSPLDLPAIPPSDDPAEELAITRTETATAARVTVQGAKRLVQRMAPQVACDPNVYVGLWELAEAVQTAIYTADAHTAPPNSSPAKGKSA